MRRRRRDWGYPVFLLILLLLIYCALHATTIEAVMK
jgi:hypothetical protein